MSETDPRLAALRAWERGRYETARQALVHRLNHFRLSAHQDAAVQLLTAYFLGDQGPRLPNSKTVRIVREVFVRTCVYWEDYGLPACRSGWFYRMVPDAHTFWKRVARHQVQSARQRARREPEPKPESEPLSEPRRPRRRRQLR